VNKRSFDFIARELLLVGGLMALVLLAGLTLFVWKTVLFGN
jgi:hypothetical protein